MSDLRAFHDSSELKDMYLRRIRWHRKMDNLVQGQGWENGRGCAIGCLLEAYDHKQYPVELGIPLVLAHLEDRIFEGLAPADAMAWPEAFLKAINPGADLSLVWPKFVTWLLDEELAKWRTPASDTVLSLHRRVIDGGEVSLAEWVSARNACWSARSAAAADAAAAAYAAADAAYAYAAAYAAAAAADAAAAAYARQAAFKRQSEALLRLLRVAW